MTRADFVRAHTGLALVPLVPEIRLFTASAVMPLWHATAIEARAAHDVAVPFWSVPWAGGQALARWVLDHPDRVAGKRVVDFGAGSGLVAIAARLAGATHVDAIDIDPTAGAAIALNAEANGVDGITVSVRDAVGEALAADVLLAGDVWYESGPAARFEAWFRALDAVVYTGDPGRHYVPAGAEELARYDVPTTVELESTASRVTRILRIGPPRAHAPRGC